MRTGARRLFSRCSNVLTLCIGHIVHEALYLYSCLPPSLLGILR
jgi:hypothetical protein